MLLYITKKKKTILITFSAKTKVKIIFKKLLSQNICNYPFTFYLWKGKVFADLTEAVVARKVKVISVSGLRDMG